MKVVLATDGSANSEGVLDVMLFRPWPKGTEIHVITVVDRTPAYISKLFPRLGDTAKEVENLWVKDCQKLVDHTVERLSSKFDNAHLKGEVIEGDPREAIVDFATNNGADLLVIGAFGHRERNEFLLGTVTDVVVTNVPCSISVLRQVSPAAAVKEMEEKQPIEEDKYLVPIDDTPHSKYMLEEIGKRPWPDPCTFRFVNVVQPVDVSPFQKLGLVNPKQLDDAAVAELEKAKKDGLQLVEEAALEFKKKVPHATILTDILQGNPRQEIITLSRDWPADLILMGSRKIKGVANEIKMGAVSKAVLFHAPCSVEIVRSK